MRQGLVSGTGKESRMVMWLKLPAGGLKGKEGDMRTGRASGGVRCTCSHLIGQFWAMSVIVIMRKHAHILLRVQPK
jgi:hypothetical protein